MSNSGSQAEKDEIARHILGYLADYPDSGDTLEGILHWWLLERRIRSQAKMVQDILAQLVQEGAVRESGPDILPTRYKLNRSGPGG